jgi:DNA-binding CsgD family transcriptional regulator
MEEVTPQAEAKEARPPSVREVEVLALVARGMSNQEIAEALTLAESTVKRHLANAYEKMDVHSRSGAVDAALRSGLLSSEEVWGGRHYPRYRCEAPGCGCEMIMVRPPSEPAGWRRPVCHGREMGRDCAAPGSPTGRLSPDTRRIEHALLGQSPVQPRAALWVAGGVPSVGLAPRVLVEVG